MKTSTHTAPPVDLDRLVLHLHAGQTVAECPHCKGALTKETPILKGDETQERRDGSGVLTVMRMALDPRPKCPHCYGRFELVIHLQNDQGDGRRKNGPTSPPTSSPFHPPSC